MHEDKIYDNTALDMFKRLEVFLNNYVSNECDITTKINSYCEKYCKEHPHIEEKELQNKMHCIRKKRNSIVHPSNVANEVAFKERGFPIFDIETFKEFQKLCFEIDNILGGKMQMKDVMLPTLKYYMGNAGDIIKHGLLTEFVEWWKDSNHETLCVADTFGGCPWSNLSPDGGIRKMLLELKSHALGRAYSKRDDKYLGSSHLIRQTAEKCEMSVNIDISDENEAARCNLENSILGNEDSMKMIKLPDNNNGYTILDDGQKPEQYNLILIDPYSEFLRDEFYWDKGNSQKTEYFVRLIELTKKYPNLFIAVFVLDMNKENKVGKEFAEFKTSKLSHCTFSLCCPKQTQKDKYNFEILLMGQQIADGKCDKLRERLKLFAPKASDALFLQEGKKIEFWPERQS